MTTLGKGPLRLSRNRHWGHPRLDRLAGTSHRRLGAAPGRANAHGPYQPSDWPLRRYLADADAAPETYPEVDRIFVHPAIKQELCDQAGRDRAWLSKVRPWWGQYYHFHVRLACPPGNGCRSQSPAPQGDGCKAELDEWFARLVEAEFEHDRRAPATRPNRGLMLGDLPKECRAVLTWGGRVASVGRLANDKPAGPPPPRLQFRGSLLQDGPPSSIWGD